MAQEIEILSKEQIEALPKDAVAVVGQLNEDLPLKQLEIFVPVVQKYIDLRDKASKLKAEYDEEGEITQQSIEAYKEVKKDQRSFNGELKKRIKEIKDPINDIRKGIIDVDKTFKTESDKIKEAAEKEFFDYEEAKRKKAEELQAKKDAEMNAKIREAEAEAEELRAKQEKANAFNRIKYELITNILEKTHDVLSFYNEESLMKYNASIVRMSFEELTKDESIAHLSDEQIKDLMEHFYKTRERSLAMIDKRLEEMEQERENALEQAQQEAKPQTPPPPARNEDVAPANPDVPTGHDLESNDEEFVIYVTDKVKELEEELDIRMNQCGVSEELRLLKVRFNKFNS